MAIYINQYPKRVINTRFERSYISKKKLFHCRMLDQNGSNNIKWTHILSYHLVLTLTVLLRLFLNLSAENGNGDIPPPGSSASKCLWPVPCGRSSPTLSRLYHLPMMTHYVTHHISRQHILPVLPSVNPSLQEIPVGGALLRYPSPVLRLRLIPRLLAGVSDRANCLPEIGP